MQWLWTDDLAALLIEHDGIDPALLAGWMSAPFAYRVPEGEIDRLVVARSLYTAPEPEAGEAA